MTDESQHEQDGAEVDRVIIECPECGTEGEAPKWWLGHQTECKECDNRFTQVIPTRVVSNDE